MTRKIFRSMLLAAVAALLACLLIVMGSLYDYYRAVQERQLKDELRLAACGVEASGSAYFDRLGNQDGMLADYRLTWIAADGTVLYDTFAPAATLENHGERAEVREAFRNGESTGARYSETLTERTLYSARALSDGTVLRISIRQATLLLLVLGMLQPFLVTALLVMLLSALLAHRMANAIVEPLTALDLDAPLENDTYEELMPLLVRIHQQHQQIDIQLRELERKNREFAQITGSMNEGLLLLDQNDTVLSMNPAARRLFDGEASPVGLPAPRRWPEVSQATRQARESGHSEIRVKREGRDYQFNISRIETAEGPAGTVLLAFDVTEQAAAENSRREFTANVSHELKTPLQSIMGSAELLESGMVKAEDRQRFCGMIRAEAARLVALVEDIIHLSQLDEGADLPCEPVELLGLAHDVTDALQERAARKEITLTVSGEEAMLTGARGLLYEMLYNLCDNAIKYNTPGGQAAVTVAAGEKGPSVTVKDTGIGIPPACQGRVFERFFRVDKSRSKASGGTGLGLSIVKHIALYHHASLRLRSTPGAGTEVTVTFPAQEETA